MAPFAKGTPGEARRGFSPRNRCVFDWGKPSVTAFGGATSLCEGRLFPAALHPQPLKNLLAQARAEEAVGPGLTGEMAGEGEFKFVVALIADEIQQFHRGSVTFLLRLDILRDCIAEFRDFGGNLQVAKE